MKANSNVLGQVKPIGLTVILSIINCIGAYGNTASEMGIVKQKSIEDNRKQKQIDSIQKVIDTEYRNTFSVERLYYERSDVEDLYYKNMAEYTRKATEWSKKWNTKSFWLTGIVYYEYNRSNDTYKKTIKINDGRLTSYFEHLVLLNNYGTAKDGDQVRVECVGLKFQNRRLFALDINIEINPISKQELLDSFIACNTCTEYNEFYYTYIANLEAELEAKKLERANTIPNNETLQSKFIEKRLYNKPTEINQFSIDMQGRDGELLTIESTINFTQYIGNIQTTKTAKVTYTYLLNDSWVYNSMDYKELEKIEIVILKPSEKHEINIEKGQMKKITSGYNFLYNNNYYFDLSPAETYIAESELTLNYTGAYNNFIKIKNHNDSDITIKIVTTNVQ